MTLNSLLVLAMPFSLGTIHFHAWVKLHTKMKLAQSAHAYDSILVPILVSADIRKRFNSYQTEVTGEMTGSEH